MSSKSPDTRFMSDLAAALADVGLDAIVIGNAAAILHGAPVTTQDVDLLIRKTATNAKKLARLAALMKGSGPYPVSDLTASERIYTNRIPIDILYDRMSGNLQFASVKSRAQLIPQGTDTLLVASLEDVIASKTAAARAKDKAAIPILTNTLEVMQAAPDLDRFRSDVRKVITEFAVDRPRRGRKPTG